MTTTAVLVLGCLVFYIFLMWITAHQTRVGKSTVLAYNAAERDIPVRLGGPSLAATWVWATALFVSSAQAYTNGWVGVLWFTVPNTLAIIIMIPFALMIRKRYPTGFTLSGFMRQRYGVGTQRLYHLMLGGLAVMATSVNLLAGGMVLSLLVSIPAAVGSAVLAVGALLYTFRYGIRSSTGTGAVQMWFMIAVLAVAAFYAVQGTDNFTATLAGSNEVTSFFGENGKMVALTFGIVTAAGLLAGPIGDPTFWQRAFSYRRKSITPAFFMAAGMFVLVPLLMSMLGFAALGQGVTADKPDWVNLALAQTFPMWLMVAFLFMVLGALLSTINAQMIAAASLASDYTGKIDRQRMVVIGGLALALIVSVIPGNAIIKMFLVYSTLRSSHFLVTLLTLSGVRMNPKGVFWGIAAGLALGFPATIYGNIIDSTWQWKLIALGACSLTPMLVVGVTHLFKGAGHAVEEDYQTPAEVMSAQEETCSGATSPAY